MPSNIITHADMPIMRAMRVAYRNAMEQVAALKKSETDAHVRMAYAIILDDAAEKFTNIGRNLGKLETTR